MRPNYNIIQNNEDIAFFIYSSPIAMSNLDLSDRISEEFGIQINHATIGRFRKNLPRMKIRKLQEGRQEDILVLKFLIDSLKEQLSKLSEDQADLKLEFAQLVLSCVKESDRLTSEEINWLRDKDPCMA